MLMTQLFCKFAVAAVLMLATSALARAETAIFAGGCFWCVEADMDKVKGVTSTVSGFAGGTRPNPTYRSHKGYTEAVKVEFDPKIITYEQLTAHFLRTIDVVDGEGQFCDRGESYIPALFPLDPRQRKSASLALDQAAKDLGESVAVKLGSNPSFYPAEDYHQDYYQSGDTILTRFGLIAKSDAYKRYRKACGRDARVKELWGEAAFSFPAAGM
jgi:peptide-methionine (S)-S-oxide reductase